MTDQMNGGQVIFTHDDFGDLASAMYEDKSKMTPSAVQWDYKLPDEVGDLYRSENKKDRKHGKGGQLKEMDGHLYDYDEEGNLIAKESRQGRWEYSWYGTGMLESVRRPDGEKITFEYDALGRRTAKIGDGRITRFVWDGNVPLHEWTYDKKDRPQMVLDAYGFLEKSHEEPTPKVTTWVFDEGTFKPAAKILGEESYSIVTDYLGTPVEVYASDGEQVWTAEYDIYGKRRKGTSAPLSDLIGERCFVPMRYQGQYEDEETGLYYNRFRYYSSEEGIYLSQDPIRLLGSNPNLYAYTEDSNVWVDVFGLDCNKKVKIGQEIAPNSTVKRIRKGTNGKTIVIGRNMDARVIPSAKNIDAEYWQGFDNSLSNEVNLANNKKWLDDKIDEGYTVVDIGLDPKYVNLGGVGSKTKGPCYSMETQVAFGTKW